MGAVREVQVTFDLSTASSDIPVIIERIPAPFLNGSPIKEAAQPLLKRAIGAMVGNGLRAELAAANLFPGALAVALEMRPAAAPAQLQRGEGGVLEIPTAGVPMEPLAVQVGQVVKRLSALPLERVVDGLDSLISAARRIVEYPALPQLLSNLARTSEALAPAARQVDPTLRAAAKMAEEARANFAEMQELLDRSRALPEEFERMLDSLPPQRVRCGY